MSSEEFTEFYSTHYRLILTVAQQRLRSFSDAEDVTAEVFRIAWDRYHHGGELRLPWLYQVLRNVIGNEYRRQGREEFPHMHMTPHGTLDTTETDDVSRVRECLLLMRESERDVLYMAYWEDLTGKEIGEILGISPTAVRLRIMRAKRQLRALLQSSSQGVPEEIKGREKYYE